MNVLMGRHPGREGHPSPMYNSNLVLNVLNSGTLFCFKLKTNLNVFTNYLTQSVRGSLVNDGATVIRWISEMMSCIKCRRTKSRMSRDKLSNDSRWSTLMQ